MEISEWGFIKQEGYFRLEAMGVEVIQGELDIVFKSKTMLSNMEAIIHM